MSRSTRFALLAVLIAPPSARGQAGLRPSPCTYERCALRLVDSRLVQGIEAKPVETSGGVVPRIPLFESSPDSVRIPYEAFRSHAAAAQGIFAAALAITLIEGITLAVEASHRHLPSTGPILTGLGLDVGLGVATLVQGQRAENELQTAIGRYNAALPDR